MKIELVEAKEEDFEFAFEAKKQAMGPHIISKWGWDREYQYSVHKQRWEEKPWFLIQLNGESIGTVSIHHFEDHTQFGEFYLLDKFRNRGIGTTILRKFLADCDQASRKVVLEYLKWNPVGSLYRRHGFELTHESEIHYFMVRNPVSH